MKSKAFSAMLCLLAAAPAVAGDWTYWRGPEHNGISRETNLLDAWSFKDKKNVVWVSPIGGRSTPIVMNGRVYLNCRTADDVNDPETKVNAREQVVCRDANTGKVLWKDVFNVFQTDIPAPRVGWAPMAGDPETGYLYMHSVCGLFRCYAPDGKVVWEHSLFEDFGKISGYGGRTQPPIIDEDRVIVSFLERNWGETKGPPPRHAYFAFDKRTGKLLWTSAPGGKPYDTNYSSPIVTVIDGQRLLIGGNADGGLYAMNARTGQPVWGFKMSKRGLNACAVADGHLVYISHGEDNIDSTSFGRIQCIDGRGSGDITKTNSVWRVDNIKAGYTGLIVKDGILYVVSDTGKLYAFDSKTGDELWTHSLGTVGKGSPVWADGKLYVMEVNGNIHILKPSRKGCETLSRVKLPDGEGAGFDEIYASPAIANGKVYFVARDRTICVGDANKKAGSDPIPPLAAEKPADGKIAHVQLSPFEVQITAGDSVEYELHAFDANGRFLKKLTPKLEPQDLSGVSTDGGKLVSAKDAKWQAGYLLAKHGDLTAKARLRIYPPLPWKFNFDQGPAGPTPPGWINAAPPLMMTTEMDGSNVLKKPTPKARPSVYIWFGPSTMTGYTIQADVKMDELRRRLPNIGLTVQRYNFYIKGNYQKLAVQSWAPHKRMAKEIRFRSDPGVWYTLKAKVEIKDGKAHVLGKVWKRGQDEPKEWTLEAVDPNPNLKGSPGLYLYSLADSYYDNIVISKD